MSKWDRSSYFLNQVFVVGVAKEKPDPMKWLYLLDQAPIVT